MTYADVLTLLLPGPRRLVDLAREVGGAKGPLSAHLHALRVRGLLERPERGVYQLTAEGRAWLDGPRAPIPWKRKPPQGDRALPAKHGARALRQSAALYPEPSQPLPATRGDCVDGPRPCPLVRCHHHLAIEVTPRGSLRWRHPGREVWELEHTCVLDLADQGERTLEQVAQLLGLTRERIRQIEARALAVLPRDRLRELVDSEGARGRRHLPVLQAAE